MEEFVSFVFGPLMFSEYTGVFFGCSTGNNDPIVADRVPGLRILLLCRWEKKKSSHCSDDHLCSDPDFNTTLYGIVHDFARVCHEGSEDPSDADHHRIDGDRSWWKSVDLTVFYQCIFSADV